MASPNSLASPFRPMGEHASSFSGILFPVGVLTVDGRSWLVHRRHRSGRTQWLSASPGQFPRAESELAEGGATKMK